MTNYENVPDDFDPLFIPPSGEQDPLLVLEEPVPLTDELVSSLAREKARWNVELHHRRMLVLGLERCFQLSR